MIKPYGYKEKDFIALSEFIKNGGLSGKSLTGGFKVYADLTGKAAGSVRNMYYALAKFSRENAEFTQKHLDGKPIHAETPQNFSDAEEKELIEKIEEYKSRGVSVRKATLLLADGNAKTALRFQNKYRSFYVKRTNADVKTVNSAISGDSVSGNAVPSKDFLFKRLKKEIDKLADGLYSTLKKENARLKKEVFALKCENETLKKDMCGKGGHVVDYFGSKSGIGVPRILRH